MPRLLTRMSALGAARTRAAAPSSVATSANTPLTRAPPEVRMLSTAWSSLALLRPAMITLAPSTASLRAISRPMPASACGMRPSAISKLVARLERRLAARLINRSPRKLRLPAEGRAFLERAHRVLAHLDEAERPVTAGAVPRGLVRVNCNVPFGLHRLLPLVPRFTAAHPEVRLDIALTDRVIDLMDERADVAIRVGSMRPSQLMARKLGQRSYGAGGGGHGTFIVHTN